VGTAIDIEALIQQAQGPVRRYLLARTASMVEAAELAQETFVRAYCAMSKGEVPQRPIPWLLAIARNVFLEALREERYRRQLCEQLAEVTGREWQVPWHEKLERRIIVGSAVDALPAELREPVLLHYFAGLSQGEVASHLNTSVGAVRTRLWRARTALRGELEILMSETKKLHKQEIPISALQNGGVMIGWNGVPCEARCRHCLARNTGEVCTVPYERVLGIVDRFIAWRDREMPQDFLIHLASGYTDEMPHFAQQFEARKQRGLPLPVHLYVNGIKPRPDAEIVEMLQAVKSLGVNAITTSFFGSGETHDRFAGRGGDYDLLMRIAKLAGELGMERNEEVYLTKDNLAEIPGLLQKLDALGSLHVRHITLTQYRGRGKDLENERVTAKDVAQLPGSIRRAINANMARKADTEEHWIARLHAGDTRPETIRYALITVTEETVEELEETDPGAFVQKLWDDNDTFRAALPSMTELARLYGRPRGQRLSMLRDLLWKWIDRYVEDHPELDRSLTFDDTRTSVIAQYSSS
jgi:RNA polymerase sigma factor (sigma-70 family)